MGTGNVQTVHGQSGTFAQGITAGYPYQDWPDNYLDEIGEAGGALFLRDQSGIGRAIHYAASSYRTIFSAVAYSALRRPGRFALLRGYMNYLLSGAGIEEQPTVRLPGLSISPNPAHGAVCFRTAGRCGTIEIRDASGRVVFTLEEHEAGEYRWDGRDAGGKIAPSGTYFARQTGSISAAETFVILR